MDGQNRKTRWRLRDVLKVVVVVLAVVLPLAVANGTGAAWSSLFLFPAIGLAARLGGTGAGLLAAGLSAFATALTPPALPNGPGAIPGWAVFAGASLLLVATAGRRGTRRAGDDATEPAAKLRENEERLRLATSAHGITVYEQDADLRYTWLHPVHAEHAGALGRTDAELVGGPEGETLMREKRRVLATGQPRRFVAQLRLPDGRVRHYDTVVLPRRDDAGRLIGICGTALDVTERAESEQQRQRLVAIVEFSDDAIITKDLNGVITSWNQAATRIFGFEPAEAIGQPIALVVPPDRRAEEAQMLDRVRRGEHIDHYETKRVRKSGEVIDISLTISPLRDSAGRVIGISKIAREITERVSRERLAAFLRDLDTRIAGHLAPPEIVRRASEAVSRHLNVPRAFFGEWSVRSGQVVIQADACRPGWPGVAGEHPLRCFGPVAWLRRLAGGNVAIDDSHSESDLLAYQAAYASVGVRAFACSTLARKRAGAVSLIAADDHPRAWRPDELQFLETVLGRVWPLVERARSEEALRLSERQLRLVTDTAPVFLAHFDRGHRYKFANQTYAHRFGRDAGGLIGAHLSDVIGAEAYATVRPQLEAAFNGRRVEFEAEINYTSVGRRWVHVIYTPQEAPNGEVVGVIALVMDVTQRKQEEKELELARDQAVAAVRAKDDFLAALSHELRTPLNPAMLIASEAAENPALPADVRGDFATIRKHIELEARLIDDLLNLTRIAHGKLPLERHPIDALGVLSEALAIVRPDATEKRIALLLDAHAGEATVWADAVRLQQVFWNVLKNAVKFTPPGGRVAVSAENRAADRRLLIHVQDSGIGMSPAELGRVFDAFAQGDHAAPGSVHRFGGVGLGLTISRKLVQLHGGDIVAASSGHGQGSTFTIELPLAPAGMTTAAGLDGSSRRPAEATPPLRSVGRGRRILVVEDHAPTRDALASLLRRRNYEVLTAGSLAEARERAAGGGIAWVVSDLGLPDGDGCELMAELHQHHGLKGIALTGYGMDADLVRTAGAGFVAHLTKPVRVQALDAALAVAARTAEAEVGAEPASSARER